MAILNIFKSAQSSTVGDVVHGLLSNFATDIVGAGSGLLNNFFTAVKANPTQQNVIAQAALLMVTAPLTLPNLEAKAISDFANAGLALSALIPAKVNV